MGIKIHEIKEIDGSATILLVRGKYRPGFDLNIECKWKGNINFSGMKSVEGTLFINDVTESEDPEDWEYSVTVSENLPEYRAARNIVKKNVNREAVIDVIKLCVKEFKAKK